MGIAGEDDLDAPDLQAPTTQNQNQSPAPLNPKPDRNRHLNGGGAQSGGNGRAHLTAAKPALGAEESSASRDRLLAELSELGAGDDAAIWARRRLPEKNRLTAADAQLVEQAFQAKLAAVPPDGDARDAPGRTGQPMRSGNAHPRNRGKRRSANGEKQPRTNGIDKSVLAFPEPRRIRDRDHVRFVARQPCLVCGRQPSDPHHVRFAQSPALGRKVSDEFTVPLCRGHHREVHRCGDEAAWWKNAGVDPTIIARALWSETHPLPGTPDAVRIDAATFPAAVGADQRYATGCRATTGDRPISQRGPIGETKPNIAAGSQ